jgi:hypothetical protein
MWQLFNLSYWSWLVQTHSPAAYTRAYFEQWPRKRVDSDTHAEKR